MSGFPELFFRETKRAGGINVKSTKNLQFELIHPNVQVFTPSESTITSNVRTISAQVLVDTKMEQQRLLLKIKDLKMVVINENNYFDNPRMVASRVNEEQFISELPGSDL